MIFCLPLPRSHHSLIVLLRVQNPQNGKEQVDDIEVQRDGSSNLFLNMVVAHNQLRVNKDITGEDQGADNAVSELDFAIIRKEHSHEAEQDENPESSKKIGHPACEIVLCLTGKQTQGHKDAKGEDYRFEHNLVIGKGDDDGDGVCFHGCEATEEQEVHRI